MKKPFLSHIKKVEQALIDADTIPLIPKIKSFGWDDFSSQLSNNFGKKNLYFRCIDTRWKTPEELASFTSPDFWQKSIILYPLTSYAYFFMEKTLSEKLSAALIATEQKIPLSEDFYNSFFHYLLLQGLSTLEEMEFFYKCSPKIAQEYAPLEHPSLCYEIEITLENHSFWCYIAIPTPLRSEWERHLAKENISPITTLPSNLEVTLHAIGGHVTLNKELLSTIKVGDFLLLDRAGYDPKNQKGHLVLCLGTTPLYHAKLKQNRVKLTDFAQYYEENTMVEKAQKNESAPPEESPKTEETLEEAEPTSPAPEKGISLKNLPFQLTVEVARFNIVLDKLVKLQPGNFLELPIHPTDHVNLTVDGKVIAKGELIEMGEAFGVRIIEMNE